MHLSIVSLVLSSVIIEVDSFRGFWCWISLGGIFITLLAGMGCCSLWSLWIGIIRWFFAFVLTIIRIGLIISAGNHRRGYCFGWEMRIGSSLSYFSEWPRLFIRYLYLILIFWIQFMVYFIIWWDFYPIYKMAFWQTY